MHILSQSAGFMKIAKNVCISHLFAVIIKAAVAGAEVLIEDEGDFAFYR